MTSVEAPVTKRIAVLAFHSSPVQEPGSGDAGGMTVYVRALARALADAGVRTDIFTRATSDEDRAITLADGVRVVPVKAGPLEQVVKERLPELIPAFAEGIRAYAVANRIRYDVIHSHYWQSGLAGADLARWWGVPLVHSAHTLGRVKNSHLAPGDVPEPLSRIEGEEIVIAAADALVTSTEGEARQLLELYGADQERLKTLPPGVDHDLFSPGSRDEARAEIGLEDRAVILSVGRIQPLKGVDLAIATIDQLRHALDREPLLVVVGGASGVAGDHEVARLREMIAERGLEEYVSFVGPQPHGRLPLYYRAAEAVLVCSHSESFGLTVLEAHSCGIPVVGTPVGGLSNVVAEGRSGFLLEERDPAAFAARLKTILSDPQLAGALGDEASRIAATYSWSHTAQRFCELYDCLVRDLTPDLCAC